MKLTDIQVFIKVATVRNFSVVASQIGLTRSAVSRSISRLEKQLGVKLLHRSPRHVGLTEAGLTFYRHTAELDDTVQKAIESVSGAEQLLLGDISAAVPSSIGAALMPSFMGKFRAAYPKLTLNLQFGDIQIDSPTNVPDVEIRVTEHIPDSVSSYRLIGTTQRILVASRDYIDQHGLPIQLEDIRKHRCLALSTAARAPIVWRFSQSNQSVDIPVDCGITANTNLALVLAACMGQGILYIPEILVSNELLLDRLRIILADCYNPQPCGIYAIYSQQKPPAKVLAFTDFVEQEISELPYSDHWVSLTYSRSQICRAPRSTWERCDWLATPTQPYV